VRQGLLRLDRVAATGLRHQPVQLRRESEFQCGGPAVVAAATAAEEHPARRKCKGSEHRSDEPGHERCRRRRTTIARWRPKPGRGAKCPDEAERGRDVRRPES